MFFFSGLRQKTWQPLNKEKYGQLKRESNRFKLNAFIRGLAVISKNLGTIGHQKTEQQNTKANKKPGVSSN